MVLTTIRYAIFPISILINIQWMAVDLNGFGKKENIMWIVEQIPGHTMKRDVTPFLYEKVGLGE